MAKHLSDTHPEIEAMLLRLRRELPAWRRWEFVCQLNELTQTLRLQGLREQYPEASPARIQRLFASEVLGSDLAERIYTDAPDRVGEVRLNEITIALQAFIEVLERLGIRYFLGGSMASAVYSDKDRTTKDADVVVDLAAPQVEELAQALGSDYYADPDMMRDAIQRRSSFNIIHFPTMMKIDVFIPKARQFDQNQFDRSIRRSLKQGSTEPEVFVASAEDIIIAKLEWYRMGNEVSNRQWEDVVNVITPNLDRLDMAYLRQSAAEVGVSDLLGRALLDAQP